MEIRKSGKIAGGIIFALGTIGALHLFIFQGRASQYEEAKLRYNEWKDKYTQQGVSPNPDEIYKFEYDTFRYQKKFWETVAQLRVGLPSRYIPGPDGVPTTPVQQQAMWDILRELERRRDAGAQGQGPKLTFLTNVGWALTDTLPQIYGNNQIAPEDDMILLANEAKLLATLNPTTPVYQQRAQGYQFLLARMGLDINQRAFLRDQYGDVAASLFTLNRIDQLKKKLPANYFRNLSEQQSLEEMYKLFRIEWPKDFMGNTNYLPAERQLTALMDILDAAQEAGVEDIQRVKLHAATPIFWEPPKSAEELAATPAPVAMEFQGEFMDEQMMIDSIGGGGAFGLGGRGAATPTPMAVFDAAGAPIEVDFVGSNSAVMTFLYRVANGTSPLELDRVRITQIENQEGKVRVSAYLNVVVMAMVVGLTPEDEFQKKAIEAEIKLAALALDRPAVREQALADGIIVMGADGRPALVAPSPTYWGGMTPTPVPPPPAADVSLPGI